MYKNLKSLRSSSLTWSLICILILKFVTQHNERRKLFVGGLPISHEIFKNHLRIFSGSKSELLRISQAQNFLSDSYNKKNVYLLGGAGKTLSRYGAL